MVLARLAGEVHVVFGLACTRERRHPRHRSLIPLSYIENLPGVSSIFKEGADHVRVALATSQVKRGLLSPVPLINFCSVAQQHIDRITMALVRGDLQVIVHCY